MLSSILNLIEGNGMQEKKSFEEIMAYLKKVRANHVDEKYHTSCETRTVAKECKEVGINLDTPSSFMAP